VKPGLRAIAVTRCPGGAASARLPPAFEPPELAPQAQLDAQEALGVNAGSEGAGDAIAPSPGALEAAAAAATVGNNVLAGGLYGFCGHLVRPSLQQAARNAGALGPAVRVGGEAGTFGLACLVAGTLSTTAKRIGGLLTRIPVLGSTSAIGVALQFGIATFVGEKVGEALVGPPGRGDEVPEEVFIAKLCVMCHTPFEMGSGQRVAALACGHACLCGSGEDCGSSCADVYMSQRPDCPLCRCQNVSVSHILNI